MLLHNNPQNNNNFASKAARTALGINSNIQNIQNYNINNKKDQNFSSGQSPIKLSTRPKLDIQPSMITQESSDLDKIVESVENATKRLSQISINTNSSKRKSKNHVGPWRLGRTLGRGSTGRVRLAKHSETGQLAAVKIVPKSRFQKNKHSENGNSSKELSPYGIEREIIIMKLISHENIMGLYDVWDYNGELYLVLEYVEGGELFDYLIKQGKLKEKEAVHYFRQIISGVSYCHQFNICHRDLKPENLLLDKDLNIKIADFGMAALEMNQKLLETSCGSPHYASPEIVTGKTYHGSPSDVWSCGIILFALLAGHLPFDDENIRKLLMKVQSGKFTMPSHVSPEAKDLIWKMLKVNPNDRIKIFDVFNHPLLKKYETSSALKNSKYEKAKLDAYFNKVESLTLKRNDLDKDILQSLSVLFHGATEAKLIPKLLSSNSNSEKIFYFLLLNYKESHKFGQKSIKREKSVRSIPGDGLLKKSKSMARTTILLDDGSKSTKTDITVQPPLVTTPSKKISKSSNGKLQISASSSYRRGVSFSNKQINQAQFSEISRSSSKKSMTSVFTNPNILLASSKKYHSLLPSLPDLDSNWFNIEEEGMSNNDFASIYKDIFRSLKDSSTPIKLSPKKSNTISSPLKSVQPTDDNVLNESELISIDQYKKETKPKIEVKLESSEIKSEVKRESTVKYTPISSESQVKDQQNQTVIGPQLKRETKKLPKTISKPLLTLDPKYKSRKISNDNEKILNKFGVNIASKKSSSRIYYSKSSTSVNLSSILKNEIVDQPVISEAKQLNISKPKTEYHHDSFAILNEEEEGDKTRQQQDEKTEDRNRYDLSVIKDLSFDFEVPTKTEIATMIAISNGSDLTIGEKVKGQTPTEKDFDELNNNRFQKLSNSGSYETTKRRARNSSLSIERLVYIPGSDTHHEFYNNPIDLTDLAIPTNNDITNEFSKIDEMDMTRSTILNASVYENDLFSDDDINNEMANDFANAKRLTSVLDSPPHEQDILTRNEMANRYDDDSCSFEHELGDNDKKYDTPIVQSPLKSIQQNDFKSSSNDVLLFKMNSSKLAQSNISREQNNKPNWFTKFFSSILPKEKKKVQLNKIYKCSIPMRNLEKAIKSTLQLKSKEGSLVSLSESKNIIRATIPSKFTISKPLKFEICYDHSANTIELRKVSGPKKDFKKLTVALDFVIENATQVYQEDNYR
ncbi:hypothetical protein WICMUC_003900 [Wickerhamomyces mucosus]|uniref:non-specific serine/threonine protein kinase n=1 Tax=Wickerhamomyces mucosus TaxID=1378264 RepID=A0A9P8PJ73_9ASCO|nr:hypothetical protein WICMUC_003900 [Wickerhamomyces mucosus]